MNCQTRAYGGVPRRRFLAQTAALAGSLVAGCRTTPRRSASEGPIQVPDPWVVDTMAETRTPGLSACYMRDGQVVWAQAYGWANVEAQVPMTPDTIQSIASISKTVTATAVMQLWQEGRFELDDDVGDYVGFAVRNPHYPNVAISIRQLLTHTASIKDGPAYDDSYAPGDPTVSLREWVTQYFNPGGRYYGKSTSYYRHRPGTKHRYSNVAYGLLGFLVEEVSGEPFNEYCTKRIFQPLGMKDTGWFLREVDLANHATLYAYIPPKKARRMKEPPELVAHVPENGGFAPLELYSFPNYPDGLVRTSVREFARFLIANLNAGASILEPAALDEIFSVQFEESDEGDRWQGLAWYGEEDDQGRTVWSHSGGDPGVSTYAAIRPADGVGVAAFANIPSALPGRLVERLLKAAPSAV